MGGSIVICLSRAYLVLRWGWGFLEVEALVEFDFEFGLKLKLMWSVQVSRVSMELYIGMKDQSMNNGCLLKSIAYYVHHAQKGWMRLYRG